MYWIETPQEGTFLTLLDFFFLLLARLRRRESEGDALRRLLGDDDANGTQKRVNGG